MSRTFAVPPDTPFPRAARSELLAGMDLKTLEALADSCLVETGDPELIAGPEVGVLVLTVREPVEATRMHLSDVLVTRAEVEHRSQRGWGMRMGEDKKGAVAAAICDAEAAASGPMTASIDEACVRASRLAAAERRREWEALQPTIVNFEEMN